MDRIPPQYDYCNTADEPWLSDNMQFTNDSSSGSGELYSTFTTPVSPLKQQLSWYEKSTYNRPTQNNPLLVEYTMFKIFFNIYMTLTFCYIA